MAYSDKVVDHYNNPRNVGSFGKDTPGVGTGLVGAPECGDVMKLQIKVNLETGVIEDAKFKTFGCGSAIASSTVLPLSHSVARLDDAMALPHPNVLNLASSMTPVSRFTLICSFMTSPHSGAPTRPVPTPGVSLPKDPTLRGLL